MPERREFSRVAVDFPVVLIPTEGQAVEGRLGDISVAGIFVRTESKLERGVFCAVIVRLMGDVAIEGRGEVIRVTEGGLALSLESLNLDSYEHLCNLVSYNADDGERARAEIEAHPGIRRLGTPLPLSPNS